MMELQKHGNGAMPAEGSFRQRVNELTADFESMKVDAEARIRALEGELEKVRSESSQRVADLTQQLDGVRASEQCASDHAEQLGEQMRSMAGELEAERDRANGLELRACLAEADSAAIKEEFESAQVVMRKMLPKLNECITRMEKTLAAPPPAVPLRRRGWIGWFAKRALPVVIVLFLAFFALLKLGEGIQSETIRGSIASVNEWLSQETPLDYSPVAVSVGQPDTSGADPAQLAALRDELDSLRKRAGQAEAGATSAASRVSELEQQLDDLRHEQASALQLLSEAQSREAALTAERDELSEVRSRLDDLTVERDQLRRVLSGAARIQAVNGQIALPQGLAPANATQWSGAVGGRQLTAVPVSQSHQVGDGRGLAVLYFFGGTGNQQFLGQAIILIE